MFLYGLVVGSFLNVLIYRMPREESITTPPSHCPACGVRLRPRDLIPLLSFLIARGRCRYCGARISPRYFGVELLTGVLFALTAWLHGITLDAILEAVFIATLVATFFIDLDFSIIPDELNYTGVAIGLARDAYKLAVHDPNWALARVPFPFLGIVHVPRSIAGALLCAGVFWLIVRFGPFLLPISDRFFGKAEPVEDLSPGPSPARGGVPSSDAVGRPEQVAASDTDAARSVGAAAYDGGAVGPAAGAATGEGDFNIGYDDDEWDDENAVMGWGDVKLVAAFGANLTAAQLLITFLVGTSLGAVIGLLLIALKIKGRRDRIPFGPFLVTGAIVGIFWGAQLLQGYLRWAGFPG